MRIPGTGSRILLWKVGNQLRLKGKKFMDQNPDPALRMQLPPRVVKWIRLRPPSHLRNVPDR
jgi:hypothetical protein